MKTEHIVEELKAAARQLGLRVRVDNGSFRGGRCRVEGEELIVLNRRHLPEAHLMILAEGLRGLATDTVFLRPAVRDALEAAWRRQDEARVEAPDADE